MLKFARNEVEAGPVAAPRTPAATSRPSPCWAKCFPPIPFGIGMDAGASGPGSRTGGADARMARTLCGAGLRRGRRHPSILHGLGARVRSGGPHRDRLGPGWARWNRCLARCGGRGLRHRCSPRSIWQKTRLLAPIAGALAAAPVKGRITVSGYEGSELLVARLLIESGADVPYVGTACPRTRWKRFGIGSGWRPRASRCSIRASLVNDIAAVEEFGPDLAHWDHAGGSACQAQCHSRRCILPT